MGRLGQLFEDLAVQVGVDIQRMTLAVLSVIDAEGGDGSPGAQAAALGEVLGTLADRSGAAEVYLRAVDQIARGVIADRRSARMELKSGLDS